MRSKQINFYALPSETSHFQEWMLEQDILFIKQPIRQTQYLFDTNNTMPDRNKEWSKVYLTGEQFKDRIFTDFHEKSGFFYINELKSLAVEFSRPELDMQGRLNRCRLYYSSGGYESGVFLKKDPEFIKWADRLMQRFKRSFLVKFSTPQADYGTSLFVKDYPSLHLNM